MLIYGRVPLGYIGCSHQVSYIVCMLISGDYDRKIGGWDNEGAENGGEEGVSHLEYVLGRIFSL